MDDLESTARNKRPNFLYVAELVHMIDGWTVSAGRHVRAAAGREQSRDFLKLQCGIIDVLEHLAHRDEVIGTG